MVRSRPSALAGLVALVSLGALTGAGCGGKVQSLSAVALPDAGGPVVGTTGFDASPPPLILPDASRPPRDAGVTASDAERPDVTTARDAAGPEGPEGGFDGTALDGGWVVAAHYPMPIVADYGGPILATPVFTAVTFPTYDLEQEAQEFVATVGATAYWTAVVGEYGVGPATATAPIVLTESAPTAIDDSAIQTWLAGKLDGSSANAAFGTPTSSSVYVLFYPTGTSVTLDQYSSCINGGFGGYHNSLVLAGGPWAGMNVSYAVVPECTLMMGAAASLTETTSHELIEASTDPLPLSQTPAYVTVDDNDFVWELLLGGGEVADMCAQNLNADLLPAGFIYPVQRSWSNTAARAGHDPCQPSTPGIAYFNAIPVMNAPVSILDQGQSGTTYGLSIPIGSKQTVEVDLYSDGPVADWTVSANDLSQVGTAPYLDFSWDKTTGNNGTKLHLTITVLAAGSYGGEPFEVLSTAGTLTNYWLGFVGQ